MVNDYFNRDSNQGGSMNRIGRRYEALRTVAATLLATVVAVIVTAIWAGGVVGLHQVLLLAVMAWAG